MTWVNLSKADPYSEWTLDALKGALRDAEQLYHLLGALDQKRMDFNEQARRLREVSDNDRQILRLRTAGTLADLRFALRRRGGSA